MTAPTRLPLTEYEPLRLPTNELSPDFGTRIWEEYRGKIEVNFPSPKTENHWELTSLGYVGFAPVTPDFVLELQPRVPILNVFRMLEHGWKLRGFDFGPGLVDTDSIEEFFERLAVLLARRVSDRTRRGLHREYLEHKDTLPFLRGRLDIPSVIRRPWAPVLPCRFEEHTVDVFHNRVLAWTLHRIALSPAATERSRPWVGRAFRPLQGAVALEEVRPSNLAGAVYTRLNEDYRVLHALARFFLEHAGPTHQQGGHRMVPFLIHMPRLFELFVAEWLKANLPTRSGCTVAAQEKFLIQAGSDLHFRVDIVIRNAAGSPLTVLDTKYKVGPPSADDIAQIVAYAEAEGCREGILVYADPDVHRIDERVGDIRIRTLAFPIDGDLQSAGLHLINQLWP